MMPESGPEFELNDKVLKALDAVYAAPGEPATKQAQIKLRRALMAAQGKMVYYGYVPKTRVGPLFVAVNDRGLVALDFGLSEQEFVARVSQRTKATLVRSDESRRRGVAASAGISGRPAHDVRSAAGYE